MDRYKARQIAAISDAVAAARLELRRRRRYDPLTFAEAYIAHGGVQIPGRPDDTAGAAALAEGLLRALRTGQRHASDPLLAVELQRVHQETAWTEQADADQVVGFAVRLGAKAEDDPDCQALLKANHGLGPGVFRKHQVVVLQPACADCHFVPVYAHDLEC